MINIARRKSVAAEDLNCNLPQALPERSLPKPSTPLNSVSCKASNMQHDSQWGANTPVYIQLKLNDIKQASAGSIGSFATPVQKLKADARRYYDSICVPLCHDEWKERWQKMCISLQVPGQHEYATEDAGWSQERKETELTAEQWRSNPCFQHHEVTMTGLGELKLLFQICSVLDSNHRWSRQRHWNRVGLVNVGYRRWMAEARFWTCKPLANYQITSCRVLRIIGLKTRTCVRGVFEHQICYSPSSTRTHSRRFIWKSCTNLPGNF